MDPNMFVGKKKLDETRLLAAALVTVMLMTTSNSASNLLKVGSSEDDSSEEAEDKIQGIIQWKLVPTRTTPKVTPLQTVKLPASESIKMPKEYFDYFLYEATV